MSPAKASTSNDTMVSTRVIESVTESVNPLSQTDNSKQKDEAAKKAVDFSPIMDEQQQSRSKLCDEKIKLEVRNAFVSLSL